MTSIEYFLSLMCGLLYTFYGGVLTLIGFVLKTYCRFSIFCPFTRLFQLHVTDKDVSFNPCGTSTFKICNVLLYLLSAKYVSNFVILAMQYLLTLFDN